MLYHSNVFKSNSEVNMRATKINNFSLKIFSQNVRLTKMRQKL